MLENTHLDYKETGNFSIKHFLAFTKKFAPDYDEKVFEDSLMVDALRKTLDPEYIRHGFEVMDNYRSTWTELGIQFCKYMFDKYEMPFLLSDEIWNVFITKYLFGESEQSEEYYYIDLENLIEELQANSILYGLNLYGEIGRVFGIDYIYDFLEFNELISAEGAQKMKDNAQYIRHIKIDLMDLDIWKLSYILNWPKPEKWESLKPWLEKSTTVIIDEEFDLMEYFVEIDPLAEHVLNELDELSDINYDSFEEDDWGDFEEDDWDYPNISEYKDTNYFQSSEETFINDKPKIGRNDLCPCGSGKKYKKCYRSL